MKKRFSLLRIVVPALAVLVLCTTLHAQRAVQFNPNTKLLIEGFGTGANTIKISATGTLEFVSGFTLTGGSHLKTALSLNNVANVDTTNASNITSGSLALARIAQSGATSGQVMAWNGTAWAPATSGGGLAIDSTAITGGTVGKLLYHKTADVLGELDTTGTGNVVLSASPTLTGTPLAPSPALATDSTQIATTAFVHDAAGAMAHQQRVIPVGTHTEHSNDGNQSNGTDTTTTSRTRVYIACDCTDLQLLLTNIWSLTSPQANPDNITVKAAVEIGGTIYPLFIRGSRTAVLAAGAAVLTDPFSYSFTAGTAVYLRVNVSVSSGDQWPRWTFFDNGVDQFEVGSDMTDSGTLTGSNGYSYRASGVYARPASVNQGAVAVVGDSIATGSGGNVHYNGFIQRAFGGDYGKTVPHAMIAAAGENLVNNLDQTKMVYRLGIIRGCTAALVEMGTNDAFAGRTAAQMKADYLTLYARLRALGIRRIYQTTLTPRTTSTDSFATVGNQTAAAGESVRVDVNAWIRANTAGIEGYFEIADIVESARDSGKWKAGYTADGIHPNDSTHTLMAAGITTAGLLQLP